MGSSAKQGLSVKKTESELAAKNLEYFNDYCEWKEQNISGSDVNSYPKMPYMSEANTRKLYIDLYLKEAGWDVMEKENIPSHSKAGIEIEVEGMPNSKGLGYCDYVLYGKDGRPLAIVEAKKTSVEPEKGRHQVELYGECMKAKYGYIPILYYTNGYEIRCIDGIYPPRRLLAFHTESELEVLLQRRSRSDITNIKINDNITNRGYQKQAITAICDRLNKKHRRGLLVMATGTGKTRISISLVDVLARSGWVKSVLFLADRTSLVSQAHSSFKDLLPEFPTCVLSENGKDKNIGARLMFSTYQTMINYIDSEDKIFSTGRFDLILIDEAHRSIFNKYGTIFEYFDSFLIGLTATPKSDVDFNTYRIFNCESGEPNFAYGLEEAVKDKYLVPYRVVNKTTKRLQRGFKYEELSADERRQLEEQYGGIAPTPEFTVSSSKLFREIYNENTCDVVIQELMNNGLKVSQGDLLGKTIIFAYNHKHAQMIVDRFNVLYPRYGSEYCQLIDNYVNYADDLIEKFKVNDNFRIAVSVDMLDTGIDVPSVLNLVFFKPVSSKVKFVQMIGRGTRLCKDLYGVGQDKKEFYIFDYCKNFEFFSENPKGIEANTQISLTERIYGYKLDLIVELQNLKYQSDDKFKNYREELIQEFIEEINKLNKESFLVKAKVHYIEQFSKKENWVYISTIDLADIKENLIPLFIVSDENESAKRFDNLLYQLQVKRIRTEKTSRCENAIIDTVSELEKLGTVPQVKEKQELILKVAETDYLKEADFWKVEEIRKELRDLIQFIDPYNRPPVYIDIEDTLNDIDEEYVYVSTGNNFTNYRKKLEKFLTGNLENSIIWKIRHNIRLTELEKENLEKILFEELGSNKEYAETFGDTNVIKAVRNIVGLDKSVASDIFYKYINENRLNMKQIQFVKLLVDYVVKNGTIEMEKLTEQPFNTVGQVYELFGNNVDLFKEIREDIEEINENAEKLA